MLGIIGVSFIVFGLMMMLSAGSTAWPSQRAWEWSWVEGPNTRQHRGQDEKEGHSDAGAAALMGSRVVGEGRKR
jgi:hypothetical protein